MKRGLLAAAMALTTALGFAQSVSFVKVLDTEKTIGASVNSGTYVPVANKYIIGDTTSINVFDGTTGAQETDLNITGITPASNGFFALMSTEDGFIYGYENGGDDMWRWSSISDTPTKVADTVPGTIERVGATATVGGQITIATTGSQDDDIVNFFSDSFPFASGSFTFNESVDLNGKSGIAMNSNATVLYTIGSTGGIRSISKWVKNAGTWSPDPVWPEAVIPTPGTAQAAPPNYPGPMVYDDVNNILFVLDMRPNNGTTVNRSIKALNGSTGAIIGTATLENLPGTSAGYGGGYVEAVGPAGTLYFAARAGSSANNAVLYKYTYAVDTSSVDDWSLYQQ